MLRLIAALVVLGLPFTPACAEDPWREFRSDADGFSVSLPQTPVISAKRAGTTTATETNFLVQLPQASYLLTVVQVEPGKGRKNPDEAYFQGLLQHYVHGSQTTLRTSKAATIAGRPGIEAITDDGKFSHQVEIVSSGDRVYLLVYISRKGEENAPEPKRFRDSLKLLN